MKMRLGYVNIFTGVVVILTTAYYGVVVSLETAKVSAYLFGALIALCGLTSAKLEEAEDRITELESS